MTTSSNATAAPHPALKDYYGSDSERRRMLDALFDRNAGRYDAITQWFSLGSGRWYRSRTLQRASVKAGTVLLDVACGTGLVTTAAQKLVGTQGTVVGLDASLGMLHEAKAQGCNKLLHGVAERLPFPEGTFDVVTMGYALRHVSDLHLVFAEYCRVLKPGGQLVLMEIARPESRVCLAFARFYMGTVVPIFAGLGAKNESAATLMRYYWDTIEHCVPRSVITSALDQTGFDDVKVETLFGGLIKDYWATKPQT